MAGELLKAGALVVEAVVVFRVVLVVATLDVGPWGDLTITLPGVDPGRDSPLSRSPHAYPRPHILTNPPISTPLSCILISAPLRQRFTT